MFLQLTTTGPSEDVRSLLTSFQKLINALISSGAGLSGQVVKWNWVTFLTASFELSAVFANIKSYCAQTIIGINYFKVHYWLTKEIIQTDPSDRRRDKVTETSALLPNINTKKQNIKIHPTVTCFILSFVSVSVFVVSL